MATAIAIAKSCQRSARLVRISIRPSTTKSGTEVLTKPTLAMPAHQSARTPTAARILPLPARSKVSVAGWKDAPPHQDHGNHGDDGEHGIGEDRTHEADAARCDQKRPASTSPRIPLARSVLMRICMALTPPGAALAHGAEAPARSSTTGRRQ